MSAAAAAALLQPKLSGPSASKSTGSGNSSAGGGGNSVMSGGGSSVYSGVNPDLDRAMAFMSSANYKSLVAASGVAKVKGQDAHTRKASISSFVDDSSKPRRERHGDAASSEGKTGAGDVDDDDDKSVYSRISSAPPGVLDPASPTGAQGRAAAAKEDDMKEILIIEEDDEDAAARDSFNHKSLMKKSSSIIGSLEDKLGKKMSLKARTKGRPKQESGYGSDEDLFPAMPSGASVSSLGSGAHDGGESSASRRHSKRKRKSSRKLGGSRSRSSRSGSGIQLGGRSSRSSRGNYTATTTDDDSSINSGGHLHRQYLQLDVNNPNGDNITKRDVDDISSQYMFSSAPARTFDEAKGDIHKMAKEREKMERRNSNNGGGRQSLDQIARNNSGDALDRMVDRHFQIDDDDESQLSAEDLRPYGVHAGEGDIGDDAVDLERKYRAFRRSERFRGGGHLLRTWRAKASEGLFPGEPSGTPTPEQKRRRTLFWMVMAAGTALLVVILGLVVGGLTAKQPQQQPNEGQISGGSQPPGGGGSGGGGEDTLESRPPPPPRPINPAPPAPSPASPPASQPVDPNAPPALSVPELMTLLETVTDYTTLYEPSSPQHQAMQWLTDDVSSSSAYGGPNSSVESRKHRAVQRYVLAAIF